LTKGEFLKRKFPLGFFSLKGEILAPSLIFRSFIKNPIFSSDEGDGVCFLWGKNIFPKANG
jgi:hypothetical protein